MTKPCPICKQDAVSCQCGMTQALNGIVSTLGTLGGKPRIAGHRIAVQDVAIWHYQMGMSVEAIAEQYCLELAEVQEALAYYQEHKAEVDRSIAEDDAFVAEMRRCYSTSLSERARAAVADVERVANAATAFVNTCHKALAECAGHTGVDLQSSRIHETEPEARPVLIAPGPLLSPRCPHGQEGGCVKCSRGLL